MDYLRESLLASVRMISSIQSCDLFAEDSSLQLQWLNIKTLYNREIYSFKDINPYIEKENWKIIILSKLYERIDRLLDLRTFDSWIPSVRLIADIFENLNVGCDSEEPEIFKYAIGCIMKAINLEGDPKETENLIDHLSFGFRNKIPNINCLKEDDKIFITERFQTEIFRDEFKQYSQHFDLDLQTALENTRFANFLSKNSKGIIIDKKILLPKKWSGEDKKIKCAMFLSFLENFWELLKRTEEITTEISLPIKRKRDDNKDEDSIILILFDRPVHYITEKSADYLISVSPSITDFSFSTGFWMNCVNFDESLTVMYDNTTSLSREILWNFIKKFNRNWKRKFDRLNEFIEIHHSCAESLKKFNESCNFISYKEMFFVICIILIYEFGIIPENEAWFLNNFKNFGLYEFWKKFKSNKEIKSEKSLNILRCYVYDCLIRRIKIRRNDSYNANEFSLVTSLTVNHLYLIKELTVDEKEKIKSIFYTDFIQSKLGISNESEYKLLVTEILENTFAFPLCDYSAMGRVLMDRHVVVNDFTWTSDEEIRLCGIAYSLINNFRAFSSINAKLPMEERIELAKSNNSNENIIKLPFINKNIAQFIFESSNYDQNFEINLNSLQNSLTRNEEIISIDFLKDAETERKINEISVALEPILKEIWLDRWENVKVKIPSLSKRLTVIYEEYKVRFRDEDLYLVNSNNYYWNDAYLCFLVHIPKMMLKIFTWEEPNIKDAITIYNEVFNRLLLRTFAVFWEDAAHINWYVQSLLLDFLNAIVEHTEEVKNSEIEFYFSLVHKKWFELHLTKLRESTKNRIKKFMKIETIRKCYENILSKIIEENLYVKLLEEALENCFLIDFPNQTYGRTTINNIIFITSFSEVDDDLDLQDGAILVTFAHEFSHLLGRYDFSSLSQKLEYSTPEDKNSCTFDPEECGFKIEQMFFGGKIDFLTIGASKFIFKCYKINKIDNFQKQFIKENSTPKQKRISLLRNGYEENNWIEVGSNWHHRRISDFHSKTESSFE